MKGKRVIFSIASIVASLAAINAVISRSVPPLSPPLQRETGTYRWRGMDIAYTEGGDPDNPDLVLLHGIHAAGTSHEFTGIFDQLTQEHHVLVPDLPGFGRSDRPPIAYSAELYRSFIHDFIRDLADSPIVITSSLSASFAVDATQDISVERLVLVCPTDASSGRRDRLAQFIEVPVIGTAMFNLLVSRPLVRFFTTQHTVYHRDTITTESLEYFWNTAHQKGAKHAPAAFFGDMIASSTPLSDRLQETETPVTLVWGREATTAPLTAGRTLAESSGSKLIVVDQAAALPHFEQPDTFLTLLAHDLSMTAAR